MMLTDGEPGRILMQGVGIWIVERPIYRDGFRLQSGEWLFGAYACVWEVEDLCGRLGDIIIKIPVASAVVQRVGIDRTKQLFKQVAQIVIAHPRHEPRQGKPTAMDILAIYRPHMLNIWDTAQISPFYAMTAEMDNAPQGHICFCGHPTYGGTYKEDY